MTGKEKLETFLHEEEMSKSLERTGRHTCRAAISNSSTFWKTHSQETGTKKSLNWKTLANFWKSPF